MFGFCLMGVCLGRGRLLPSSLQVSTKPLSVYVPPSLSAFKAWVYPPGDVLLRQDVLGRSSLSHCRCRGS